MKREVFFLIGLFWCNFIFSSVSKLAVFIEEKNLKEIQKIIDNSSANLNYQDSRGNSLLMISIDNKWFDLANILIVKKLQINHQNALGETALSLAVLDGNVEIVKKLLDSEVDTQVKNNAGRKAINLARILLSNEVINLDTNKKQEYTEIYSLLKETDFCSCLIA